MIQLLLLMRAGFSSGLDQVFQGGDDYARRDEQGVLTV
jgi:hypothetical protein